MLLKLTFKTPDVTDHALEDVPEDQRSAVKQLMRKWVEWDEYLTVEIDTKKETCTVVPLR